MYYAGVDFHKNYSTITVMDNKGKVVDMRERVKNNRFSYNEVFNGLDGTCQAVLEASRNWEVGYNLLEDMVDEVKLANPLKVKAISSASIKTDKIDSKILAHLLRTDLIPEVYIPPYEIRSQRRVIRYRAFLVKVRTMLKNQLHEILDRNQIKIKGTDIFGVKNRQVMRTLKFPEIDQLLFSSRLELLERIELEIEGMEKWMKEHFKGNENIRILKSVPGLGDIFAPLVAIEVVEIERFPNKKHFVGYCGLASSTYSSGGKVWHGRIIKSANRWLRFAFVEASWTTIRCSEYFRKIYLKIRLKKGVKRAIIVVAKRMAEIVYQILKEKREYKEEYRGKEKMGLDCP